MAAKISEITRRDIIDALIVLSSDIYLYGRLEEIEFLSRLWDLDSIPSHDSRFANARGDIWQHTINNDDWDPYWVFDDPRFGILRGDDEIFLRFLSETIHPVVRSDATQCEQLLQLYNSFLEKDGFQLVEKTRISGKPIFVGRFIGIGSVPGVDSARESLSGTDVVYVMRQVQRMEAAVNNDPELAIGTAKELVETCCKSVLAERGVEIPSTEDLPRLVKATVKELNLTPDDIDNKSKGADTIKRLLSNLATITQGVAELRNYYGTGHGKPKEHRGLQPRHAKLAVGAASTLAVFISETHIARDADD